MSDPPFEREAGPVYPFSALIGQEAMKSALLLNAVDPSIGGVLVRGEKGTGKSTAVRSLASLLPPIRVVDGCPFNCSPDAPDPLHPECRQPYEAGEVLRAGLRPTPVVELPLSATEDRVVGTLHLERTLASGERQFEPGLLAAAHRGILYVDEVNLLPDHLVDALLDAAASGVNRVEREGIRYLHPARFLLVGTMNPEEGELRPQFLDRFGLCVTTSGLVDITLRTEVIRRRLAFDEDPAAFCSLWQMAEQALAEQVLVARYRLGEIRLPAEMLSRASRLAMEAGARGHRADLALVKAGRALAALTDLPELTPAVLVEAGRLVLPHRLPTGLAGDPEYSEKRLETLLHKIFETGSDAPSEAPSGTGETLQEWGGSMEVPGATAAGSMLFSFLKKKLPNGSSPPTKASG